MCYGTALLLAPLVGTVLYNLSPGALWGTCAAAGACAAAVITPRHRHPSTAANHVKAGRHVTASLTVSRPSSGGR
jgi:hypothetical protein